MSTKASLIDLDSVFRARTQIIM